MLLFFGRLEQAATRLHRMQKSLLTASNLNVHIQITSSQVIHIIISYAVL